MFALFCLPNFYFLFYLLPLLTIRTAAADQNTILNIISIKTTQKNPNIYYTEHQPFACVKFKVTTGPEQGRSSFLTVLLITNNATTFSMLFASRFHFLVSGAITEKVCLPLFLFFFYVCKRID